MTLALVAPSSPAITLAEAKAHLRVDHADDDALISALIMAAAAHAERWTGVAFEASTWDYVLDEFPAAEIVIPLPPLQSVTSITYLDADGVSQTVSGSYIVGQSVYLDDDWPTTQEDRAGAVTVRFTSGSETPDDVRAAMLLMIGHWYEQRSAVSDASMTEVPMGAYAILNLHRQMFV